MPRRAFLIRPQVCFINIFACDIGKNCFPSISFYQIPLLVGSFIIASIPGFKSFNPAIGNLIDFNSFFYEHIKFHFNLFCHFLFLSFFCDYIISHFHSFVNRFCESFLFFLRVFLRLCFLSSRNWLSRACWQ